MKIRLAELRGLVKEVISEARKGKKKSKKDDAPTSIGYMSDEKLDFAKALDLCNLYKRQGAANFGPFTEERAIRNTIRKMVAEELRESGTVWERAQIALVEGVSRKKKGS